ncbi:MAG: beta-N-acetylhexosaminidase [Bacteroides sp.]|nr:beta-N-acetylhexosaminidase [Bacteroides sp.]MCM1447587.1 beta-N-acetylhexosaminidase [Bacteroides sp.]
MKKISIVLVCLFVAVMSVSARQFVNLTPQPKKMTVASGKYTLLRSYTIGALALPDSLRMEAIKFIDTVAGATGCHGHLSRSSKADIVMKVDTSLPDEGYGLKVTSKRIYMSASTATGFFYAFQTLKKMMPANVMAGLSVEEAKQKMPWFEAYARPEIPCVEIDDEPRFSYRGFMLDCGRHFFTVEEIKQVLDAMAIYKMNYFHWHLTEDQGWRFEVKKYPRLTTVGSVASDCRMTDMKKGHYWLGKPYGPYFYTQDDCREIVEYARDLHIEVIPEIDMPGHIMAALAAYPEFSCTPDGEHKVQTYQGGVWSDVLNVGNPKAVQFARDVLTEVMDVFPGRYVHIGGDECPTSAWEQNEQCHVQLDKLIKEGKVKDAGADSKHRFRPLQSYFIKQMHEHIAARGRKMILWNESVTAQGADLDLIKSTGATIFCWNPCQRGAAIAASLGLDAVITEWGAGCYYINRKQHNGENEPVAAGNGGAGDQLPAVYAYKPVPDNVTDPNLRKHYVGVQATFWTEHVSDIDYLNYLAFPRLLAVAEAGWSPEENKDFEGFRTRFTADTMLFQLTGRLYGHHFIAK